MSININPNTNDPSYRYKMEKLVISQTGRGGNCHTILENIINISNQINTTPDILLNYIGNVLGCNTNKTQQNNNYIYNVKGHYTIEKIQEIIFNFITFATLCNKCTIPELTPEVIKNNKDSKLNMKCSACGTLYELIGNNKYNIKLVENMIKYYTINPFVAKKGNMVVKQKQSDFCPF